MPSEVYFTCTVYFQKMAEMLAKHFKPHEKIDGSLEASKKIPILLADSQQMLTRYQLDRSNDRWLTWVTDCYVGQEIDSSPRPLYRYSERYEQNEEVLRKNVKKAFGTRNFLHYEVKFHSKEEAEQLQSDEF